jgi:hypothetical protein
MSNNTVIGDLARQIANPNHPERNLHISSITAESDADSLPVRLMLFAGLICRIKHSFLWEKAPSTMMRISSSGRSLQLFACYALSLPLNRIATLTPRQRTTRFLRWVKSGDGAGKALVELVGVRGIASHELRCFGLGISPCSAIEIHEASREDLEVVGYSADPRGRGPCVELDVALASIVLGYGASGFCELRWHDRRKFEQSEP